MSSTAIDSPPLNLVTGSGKLARALFAVFVIEFGAYAYNIVTLVNEGVSPLTALGRMFAIWFGIRFVAVGYNFALTWWNRSERRPEHRIGLLATLRLFWGELYATLIVYSFLFPFARFLPVAPDPAAPHSGPPIVLVPGFCCNRGYLGYWRRHLAKAGFGNTWAVTLEPLFGDIEDNARQLAAWVEYICEQTNAEQVILVGHSMGGLTIRSYLHQFNGNRRTAKAILVGTPHHGTVVAEGVAALGMDLKQMSRKSPWAEELNKSELAESPVPLVAITTPHDNIVAPQSSSELAEPYARNLFVPGIGHLEMIMSADVVRLIADECTATAEATATD